MEAIRCSNLLCQRGDFTLRIDNLNIRQGEKIALLGENGCGKTTFLQALSGLLPVQGELLMEGRQWQHFSAWERSEYVAYLPQEADVLFNLTVAELLDLSLNEGHLLQGEERQGVLKATEMTDFLGRIFHSLSVGEKRRAMLARVFCRDCAFLLLDEPTAPLDLRHAAQLMRYLAGSSKTVIAAIHDLNLAVRYFDRFLLMKNGSILFDKGKEMLDMAELEEIYGVTLHDCGGYFMPDF